MTQDDLDTAVAFVTGEDLQEIRRRGFSLTDPFTVDFETEPNEFRPTHIDWDEFDRQRNVAVFEHPLLADSPVT
ncbi:hypothetical protein [uncultured Rubinisphaera sp.]|uniref:hypothetical protein n=1 Tax=uncultured Rubinisphaera sp. TaxID=1678686 RepID=UPI0030DD364B|tara:strand:+ start:1062 stop:1283 length:222 start_codon:yes stop_codon:yes gene_type:complete